MKVIASLLLCVLSTVVKLHSHAVPYVSFMGINVSNHSYVDLNAVGSASDSSDSVQCHTDLSSCCSSAQGSHRGDWYFPNGDRLGFSNGPSAIYEQRLAQQVDLRLRYCNSCFISGVYYCAIDTNTTHSDNGTIIITREIIYVALYTCGGKGRT